MAFSSIEHEDALFERPRQPASGTTFEDRWGSRLARVLRGLPVLGRLVEKPDTVQVLLYPFHLETPMRLLYEIVSYVMIFPAAAFCLRGPHDTTPPPSPLVSR